MSSAVITVENLGKRYAIGKQQAKQDGIRHLIEDAVRAPFRLMQGRRAPASPKEEFWALRDVSFAVNPGDILGIIGRNGAGKSTLLKILSRITIPTSGKIEIIGRVASLLEVGTGFHPELTGRENVFLNGAILGMGRVEIRKKFEEIVAFSEVEQFLDTPVKRYSSGMYVRLAFAVAAHLESEILIVDEVLAVGDAQFQAKCLTKMQQVVSSGRTILFVGHNMGVIRRLCTTGLLLQRGRVVSSGPINRVLADYGESLARISEGLRDEHGRTEVQVRDVSLHVNGIKTDSVASGETVEIRIQLAFAPTVQQAIRVGIALESMSGLLTIINYSHFQAVELEPRSGCIFASIPRLPLVEGSYRLHLRILSGEREIYWNTGARDVRVEAGDFYGTGARGEEDLCPWIHRLDWGQTGEEEHL